MIIAIRLATRVCRGTRSADSERYACSIILRYQRPLLRSTAQHVIEGNIASYLASWYRDARGLGYAARQFCQPASGRIGGRSDDVSCSSHCWGSLRSLDGRRELDYFEAVVARGGADGGECSDGFSRCVEWLYRSFTLLFTLRLRSMRLRVGGRNRLGLVGSDGIFLGAALSVKLTAVFVIAALLCRFVSGPRERRSCAGRIAIVWFCGSLLAGVIASPWYIRTWVATGSPVFPFYMSIWPGKANGWDVERSNLFQAMNSQYGGVGETSSIT